MTHPDNASKDWNRDVARVAQEMTSRLRARGIEVYDSDSPDDVVQLVESVEEFERAVESRGGDLMMDEPPPRGAAQPDDPHFLLPTRAADESVSNYITRLKAATASVREHRPHP
jgi:hypothetical protein